MQDELRHILNSDKLLLKGDKRSSRMKMTWAAEDLVEYFTIQSDEREFLGSNDPHNQLGKAVLLKYFQYEASFPTSVSDIPRPIIEFLAQQLYLTPDDFDQYQWEGTRVSTAKRYEPGSVSVPRASKTSNLFRSGYSMKCSQTNIAPNICNRRYTDDCVTNN